jgi:TPP-dependent pyruvate/acetoin dehydrogenase alpha subunit
MAVLLKRKREEKEMELQKRGLAGGTAAQHPSGEAAKVGRHRRGRQRKR